MPEEKLALSTIPPSLPADADYDQVYAAVMASAQGRWFLAEFARRNRNSDTRLLLDAIERIEAVVRTGQARDASQSVRIELLEMARTIAQTRADVAEIKPEPAADSAATPEPDPDAASEVFAAAERLQDMAWTMRERGIEMSTCDQISELAGIILSASSLREPDDQRARKLGEVLKYLERRVDAMLDSAPPAPAAAILEHGRHAEEQAEPDVPASGGAKDDRADPLAEVAAAMASLMRSQNPPETPPPPEPAAVIPAEPLPEPVLEPAPAEPPEPVDFLLEPLPMPMTTHAGLAASPPPPAASPAMAAASEPAAATPAGPADNDTFAAIRAMSEAERIALFT